MEIKGIGEIHTNLNNIEMRTNRKRGKFWKKIHFKQNRNVFLNESKRADLL
jgi:hypothetical protein